MYWFSSIAKKEWKEEFYLLSEAIDAGLKLIGKSLALLIRFSVFALIFIQWLRINLYNNWTKFQNPWKYARNFYLIQICIYFNMVTEHLYL